MRYLVTPEKVGLFLRKAVLGFGVLCSFLGLAPLASALPTASTAMRAIQGSWLTGGRDGIFYLGPCEEGGQELCGWLTGLDYEEASPPTDYWGRSECGLALLLHLKEQNDGTWSGDILDPRSGRIYDADVSLTPEGKVKLRGYLGLRLFGQTEIWTRYHGPAPGANCRMKSLRPEKSGQLLK